MTTNRHGIEGKIIEFGHKGRKCNVRIIFRRVEVRWSLGNELRTGPDLAWPEEYDTLLRNVDELEAAMHAMEGNQAGRDVFIAYCDITAERTFGDSLVSSGFMRTDS